MSFNYTLDAQGTIKLRFSEVMNATSIVSNGFILQSDEIGTRSVVLTTLTTVNGDGTEFDLTLEKADVDKVKAKGFCVNASTCFISLRNFSMTDMEGLPIEEVSGIVSKVILQAPQNLLIIVLLSMRICPCVYAHLMCISWWLNSIQAIPR